MKYNKYSQKNYKTSAGKKKQAEICKIGRRFKDLINDIKVNTKTFIVTDLEKTKNILSNYDTIDDNTIQYNGYFINGKKIKSAPGNKEETNFVNNLKKFEGLIINQKTSLYLKNKGLDIEVDDKLIKVSQMGTKKDKESDSKKPDCMLIFQSGKKIGISYKMDKSRTVQSWSTIKTLEKLLGEEILKKITEDLLKKLRSDINKNSHRLFLGITFHLCNNPNNFPLDKYTNDKLQFYCDSNTQLLFTGTDSNFKFFEDFLQSDKLQNKDEILKDPSKKLYIVPRYIYSDITTSNNSSQALLYYKPNLHFENKNFENVKEMLKYGRFYPYYENDLLLKKINTLNLVKLYKGRNITFDISKIKTEYNSKTIRELKKLCKERGIRGYSKLKKQELINKLN